ncbi:MAG: type II toxin-antitoxin system VapC family toxin [Methanomassiliicoccus sp.]|nr:type II toxin-antitoxin system VapC family toxin [Methanomassiliicoccus sp.]
MSAPRPVVIDTNVIIDAFVRSGDGRSRGSIELLRRVENGEFAGILPTPVLVEIYYVVLDVTKDPHRAGKTLARLLELPHITVRAVEEAHAMIAVDLIRESNYFRMGKGGKLGRRTDGLSMVDSLILAVGSTIPGAIVCSNEGRFSQVKSVRTMRPAELVQRFGKKAAVPVSDGRP